VASGHQASTAVMVTDKDEMWADADENESEMGGW
jgi:hypothetical protein